MEHTTPLLKQPLPVRVRPTTLDEVIGQDAAVGEGSIIRHMLDASAPPMSIIMYAPPASGKTTIARIMAHTAGIRFVELSATSAKVADVRQTLADAQKHLHDDSVPTIVFIDEIHRFSKSQQDVLLPGVEQGVIRLVGATTENPSFSVNSALLSRCVIVSLSTLTEDDIYAILQRAISHPDGLPHCTPGVDIPDDVLHVIALNASGDARQALTLLEALDTARGDKPATLDMLTSLAPHAIQRYDRDGDQHYNIVSAFIKSMRGSDPDATLYWLARLIEGGEDPRFIARRIVIHAAEDVGLADPSVLPLAVAAQQCVALIGMPEARIPLAEAALAVATAPKSNATYLAIDRAIDLVRHTGSLPVPKHLADAHYKGADTLYGNGVGYKYPHDYPYHVVEQTYLPDDLLDHPDAHVFQLDGSGIGHEQIIAKRLQAIDNLINATDGAL